MKLKKSLALILSLVMAVSLIQFPVFADTNTFSGHPQPNITISGGSTFAKEGSFSFGVTSDMSGSLSVSVGGLAGTAVESQPIIANSKFTVNVPAMPNVSSSEIVVMVRPNNPVNVDPANAAVTGVKVFTVTANVSGGGASVGTPMLRMNAMPASPVTWSSAVFGQSTDTWNGTNGTSAFAPAGAGNGNPNNTLSIDENSGNITLSSTNDKGKIQSGSDGINYYYTTIDSASNFRISTIMNISAMNANSQCAAGLMVRDAFGSTSTKYDGASKMLMGGWLENSGTPSTDTNTVYPIAYRPSSSLVKTPPAINMKTGVDYRVELVKIGSSYTVSVSSGNNKDSVTTISTSNLPNIQGTNLYVGAFTSRTATATFKKFKFESLSASNTPSGLVVTPPAASVFFANTTPNWSDMVVTCTPASGSPYIVPSTDYYISGYDNATPGTRDATVYYRGSSATFSYSVNYDYTISMYVSIPPLKNTYAIGEVFDRTGLEIRSNNASGTQTVMTEGTAQGTYTLNVPPSFTTPGVQTITATRNGENTGGSFPMTVPFNVTVKNVTLDHLEVSQQPIKTSYYVNDTAFDGSGSVTANKKLLSGIIVKAVFSDASKEILSMDTAASGVGYAVNYATPSSSFVSAAGTSAVTLSYAGKSVDVLFTIVSISSSKLVSTAYPKTTYNIGDTLDLTGMVVKVQNNDGTYGSPLIAGTDYNAATTAVDMSKAGLYNITLQGIGAYNGLTGTLPVSVREYQNYTTGWQQVTFGQSATKGPDNLCTVTPSYGTADSGTTIDLYTKNGRGKVASGHDGINYYYRRLNKDDNFKLTADVKVITFSNEDGTTAIYGQEAFGLMARDFIGPDGDASVWPSSMFMAGALGSTSWNALYRDNRVEYIGGATANNSSMPVDNTSSSGAISPFNRLGQSGANIANTSTITIERKNNNWSAAIKQGANVRAYSYNNDIPLNYYDPDNIYVGFFTARNAHVQFSNISLTVTSSAADIPGSVMMQSLTAPGITIRSAAATTSSNYNLVYTSNAEGIANIYLNSTLVASQTVTANVPMTQAVPLGGVGSMNGIILEFFPSTAKQYASYDRITSPISVSVTQGLDTIYVSPAGGGTGQTPTAPATFTDAVSKLAQGGIIHLLAGNYGRLTLPRYNDGTATTYKKVIGQAGVIATSLTVQANFWHVKNFEVSGGSVSISGNDNVIEMISQHGSAGAGVQISRSDAATQPSLAYWPSRNVILNCEAYDNRDASENDADGFAAKLTCGSNNKFIGCISHHNIDDGWDLYAKSVPIGPAVLDYCIAYSNGHTLSYPNTAGGDGNGFKLGGEGVPVAHSISNSLAFSNKNDGFTSNSNPTLSATNNVSFDNGSANISFTSYSNVPVRGYAVNGFYSYRKDTALTSNSQDVIESMNGSTIVTSDGRKQYTAVPHSIYLWDTSAKTATNDLGRPVTDAFFMNLTKPADYQTAPSVFARDINVANVVLSGNYIHNILFADFLKLTPLAKEHTRLFDVIFDPGGGVFEDSTTVSKAVPANYDESKGYAFVTPTLPVVSRPGYTFAGWFTDQNGGGTQFTSSTAVSSSGLVVYAKWKVSTGLTANITSTNGNVTGLLPGYTFGDKVTVTAAAYPNYKFVSWTDGTGKVLSTNNVYSFVITQNTDITANFAANTLFTVTFYNEANQIISTQTVAQGTDAIAPSNPTKPNFTFANWNKAYTNVQSDLKIYPVFTANPLTFTLKVNNGTGSGTYNASTSVTVTGEVYGKQFSSWKDETGNIVSYNQTYSFIITRNMELTAVFVDAAIPAVPSVALDNNVTYDTSDPTYVQMYFLGTFTVPAGYKRIECGFVSVKNTAANPGTSLTLQTSGATIMKATSLNQAGQVYRIIKTTYGLKFYVRGYMIYKNTKTGEIVTIYSPNVVLGVKTK